MIFCQESSEFAAMPILLAHTTHFQRPRSHVLLKQHALESWTKVVITKVLIVSVRRVIVLCILVTHAYTKRENTAVSDNVPHCILLFIKRWNFI